MASGDLIFSFLITEADRFTILFTYEIKKALFDIFYCRNIVGVLLLVTYT